MYGELPGTPGDRAFNLRGQLVASYNGAGNNYVEEYDFKGIPKRSYMRLLADAKLANANWSILTDSSLVTGETFFNEVILDALGRPRSADTGRILTSGTPTTEHNITYNTYGKDGALKTVKIGTGSYFDDIRHNAKGQREWIKYGNGTKTKYIYNALNQRLRRLCTKRTSDDVKLQDLNYYYDSVGNITTIRDDAQETVWFDNLAVSPKNEYTYDTLYRLIKAKGREKQTGASFGGKDNSGDGHAFVNGAVPWAGSDSADALQHYTQYYQYDAVGNILQLQHVGTKVGSYTRRFNYDSASNRLLSTTVSGQTYPYQHDVRGNMISMPHLAAMDYDLLNQMHHVTAGTVQIHYQYSGGERVRKFIDKASVTEERIYFGSYKVYRKWIGATIELERTTLHVADDAGRIAMIEKRTQGSDGSAGLLRRYIYSNHLQSASLELDETAAIISYEEYHPYRTTAYQATNSAINAVAKRYRFTGKERDEETGLNYHGADTLR